MNQIDFEILKQQIKDELLAEMSQKNRTLRNNSTWDEISNEIEKRMTCLNGPDLHQLKMAFSTIIRHSLGINMIRYIPFSKEERVKTFAYRLLDEIEKLRDEMKPQPRG